MDAPQNENFFEISLSQEGTERLMRLFKLVKILFAFSIVLSALLLVLAYLRIILYSTTSANEHILLKIEAIVNPTYTILLAILMLAQLYSFFRFTRLCKKSILLRQTHLFNYSFKWLIRSALFSMTAMVFEFLIVGFSIYELNYFLSLLPAS